MKQIQARLVMSGFRSYRFIGGSETLCTRFVRRLRRRRYIPETLLATIALSPFKGSRKVFVTSPKDYFDRPRWNLTGQPIIDNYHLMYDSAYTKVEELGGFRYEGPIYFRLQKCS